MNLDFTKRGIELAKARRAWARRDKLAETVPYNPYQAPKAKAAEERPWWKVLLRWVCLIVFGPPALLLCAMVVYGALTTFGIVDDMPTAKYKHWLKGQMAICAGVQGTEKEECLRQAREAKPADFD